MAMRYEDILQKLESLSNPEAVAGMARFGIRPAHTFGVAMPTLRQLARQIGHDHQLAGRLWTAGIRETRILATLVDDPRQVTDEQMERWALEFDGWELCDQCCMNLFERLPNAYAKCVEWSSRGEELVKRAAFVLMARLAVSDKKAQDDAFEDFFILIWRESSDSRDLVKKAVNWALRQIGKRDIELNARAIATAQALQALESKSARWIASDALRELTSPAVQARLHQRHV